MQLFKNPNKLYTNLKKNYSDSAILTTLKHEISIIKKKIETNIDKKHITLHDVLLS